MRTLPVVGPEQLAGCCAPVTGGIVADEVAETLARTFKALSDPTRVKLLSPGPVFRALTDTVDLHLAYEGEPGSITITAELSTDGGWRSTIPLAAKTSFTGHEYQDTVQLDLAAIDAKAQAASAVTGLSSSPVAITIRAHIDTGEDPVFTPTLQLDLAPLTLGLAQDEAALTVTDTDTDTDTSSPRTQNVLNILGVQLTVTTARIAATAALLAALLAAGALAVLAARKLPGDENADIHRRYSQLLVPVRPIPAPAAGHLTDVANFSALVKLAERYGLLIMHWSDHTGHTYLVQDQDNTYRYRISTSPPPTHGPPTHTAGADTD